MPGERPRRSAAVLVLAAAFALAGCSAGMPAGPDVAPAFGDPYQEAEEAVRAHADDAALLGVRTDGNVALEEQRPWVYLFGSKRTGYSYSVQTRPTGTSSWKSTPRSR